MNAGVRGSGVRDPFQPSPTCCHSSEAYRRRLRRCCGEPVNNMRGSNILATLDEAAEIHLEVKQVAALWGMSDEAVRKLFRDEPGVLKIGRQESQGRKRRKVTLRPLSVVQRVHRRLSNL